MAARADLAPRAVTRVRDLFPFSTNAPGGTEPVVVFNAEFYEFYHVIDLAFHAELNAPTHGFFNQAPGLVCVLWMIALSNIRCVRRSFAWCGGTGASSPAVVLRPEMVARKR